jgi:SAM-dependent methyltransferase
MVYAPGYENALHHSPHFRAFAQDLAAGLVARHRLAGKAVVEIGCGDGHMLDLMVRNGAASATGFDPSMAGRTSPFAGENVTILPELFGPAHLDRPFDMILCRHVLEHLDRPMTLLHDIRAAIGPRDVPVYFEVPNAGWMLQAVSIWDVIYEHVGYWTAPALATAFRHAGFAPTAVTTGYDGQFLMIEARPTAPAPGHIEPGGKDVARDADRFAAAAQAEIGLWRDRLTGAAPRAVIWGAGSKGISFANAVGSGAVGSGAVAALIDLNPRKHGLFAPGVGLPVLAPQALPGIRPDLILIANALYEPEIRAQVQSMGLAPDFDVIAG